MRLARCLLVVTGALGGLWVPGIAQAQFPTGPVPQNLSLAGEIVARDGMKVRTVRLTVSNHGPGAFDGASAQIAVTALEAVIRSQPPECGQTWMGYRCDLGNHLEPGEVRSVDIVFEYVSTAYRFTAVQADILVVDPSQIIRGDADPADNRVFVDLDPERGPPAIALDLGGSTYGLHGAPALSAVTIRNIGGTRLTDVRLTSDRCPESAQRNESGLTQLGIPGGVHITCAWSFPPHAKGDDRITETATVTANTPDGRPVSATASRSIRFFEPKRKCGSFRARRGTYDVTSTAPDFTCAAVRRALKRCLTKRRRPTGFRCDIYKKGLGVVVSNPKHAPNDLMIGKRRK